MADQEVSETTNVDAEILVKSIKTEGQNISESKEDIFKEANCNGVDLTPPDSLNDSEVSLIETGKESIVNGTPEKEAADNKEQIQPEAPVAENKPDLLVEITASEEVSIEEEVEKVEAKLEVEVNGKQEQEVKSEPDVVSKPELIAEPIVVPEGLKQESAKVLGVDLAEEKAMDEESALDREVRLALEREQQLKIEQANRSPVDENPEDFPVHHVALAPTVEEEEEKEEDEDVPEPVKVEIQVEITEPETVLSTSAIVETKTHVEIESETVEIISTEDKSTANIDEEVVLNKPQVIGETYRTPKEEEVKTKEVLVTVGSPIVHNGPQEFPKPLNPVSDNKIALEIQEMQEREQELKKMRETILKVGQNGVSKGSIDSPSSVSISSRQSEQGSVHSEEDHSSGDFKTANGQASPSQSTIARAISLDSLHNGQPYNIGYAFGHRRKDGVKVKPLADTEDKEEDHSSFGVLTESPIEREIRLGKDREEELRREKGLVTSSPVAVIGVKPVENGKQRPATLEVQTNGKLPSSKTSPFQVPNKNGTSNGTGDTQRFLATSRIQQEIEEQTEREKALRAFGMIQTISQERTDAKVTITRLRDSNGSSPDTSLHTPVSPSPSLTDSDKSSSTPLSNSNGINKSPSPTNSTVSGGNSKANSQAGRRFSNPPNGRSISMQRFIASKGKDVVSTFSTFNSSKEKSHSVLSLHHVNGGTDFYHEMKPPMIPKDKGTPSPRPSPTTNGIAKRSLTAESKIQEELKEMQAREDELKQQRARLIGLSQPNLSLLDDEIIRDGSLTNGHEKSENGTNNLDRANSNPNLLEDDDFIPLDKKDKKNVSIGGPRRRSMLIDQWEKRIQSSDIKS